MPSQRFIVEILLNPIVSLTLFWAVSWFSMRMFGGQLVDWLKHRKGMKWAPREDTPDSHLQKAGTPSMGGIGIIGVAFISCLSVFICICGASYFVTSIQAIDELDLFMGIFPALVILHAVLGYIDDYSKATNRGGLTSRAKLLGQALLASLFIFGLYLLTHQLSLGPWPPSLIISDSQLFTSWATVIGAVLVIIGTSNAVNLTDGIDGLVSGLCVQVGLLFSILWLSSYGDGTDMMESSTMLSWMSLGGACLGFLAFNKHPAKIFMGDTGSLALGAALGAGAVLTGTISLLPFIGFIFFVEMFSVIIQVLYFKITRKMTGEGKRVFRRAPLHHHFELGGWSEKRVVATFWAVNLLTSGIGLALWKMQILPRFP